MALTPGHRELLTSKAITSEIIERIGVYSITDVSQLGDHAWAGERAVPAIAFPWRTPGGQTFIQLRPDVPIEVEGEKRPRKYLWPNGQSSAIAVVREDKNGPAIFVEGTKQSLAAASYVDSGSVYGIAGCRSWSTDGIPVEDLDVTEGRDVVLIFDADVTDNPDVYDAAERFTRALRAEGALSVRYVILPAGQKAGLDDILGSRPDGKRAPYLSRLIEQAVPKLGKRPARKGAGPAKLPGTDERPMIAVNEDRLVVIDTITATLRRKWDGTELFSYGGLLAWREGVEMQPIARDRFNDLTAKAAVTVTVDTRGNVVPAWPDAPTQGAALSRAVEFTALEGITRTPFVRPDGSVCQSAGYDPDTRTYLVMSEELSGMSVPDSPGVEDIRSAVKLLSVEWLGDLMDAMDSDSDRANALALVLTPLIRGLVPLAPLAVVNGLQMGVGKNLLADLLSILATGEVAQPLPYSRDDEENRKVITAAFRSGKSLLVFDEAHHIEGAALQRAITSGTYTDRILGVSMNAEWPNRITWVSLGNNVSVAGDMARRFYMIRLAPKVEKPEDRSADDFRHPDIKAWTREHRAELIAAALTLVRAWFCAGRPQNIAGRKMGSFEQWGGMVGGILDVAGVEGFLGNLQEWRSESDYERSFWLDHYRWLGRAFGGDDFTTAEVVRAMKSGKPAPVEHPPGKGLEDHDGAGYPRALGLAYGRQKGKTLDGLRLVKTLTSAGHGNRWKIIKTDPDLTQGVSPSVTDGDPNMQGADPTYSGDESSPSVPIPDLTSTGVDGGDRGDSSSLHTLEKTSLMSGDAMCDAYKGPGGVAHPPINPINPSRPLPGDITAGASTVTPQVSENGHETDTDPDLRFTGNALVDVGIGFEPEPARSPISVLLPFAAHPAAPECPDCDQPKGLVPPAGFWYACRRCNPQTFHRG
jgi:hypothetical protein